MAVKKMIEHIREKSHTKGVEVGGGGGGVREHLRVVIVPASDKYKKPSLNVGSPDYLSEEARHSFLVHAFGNLGYENVEVIISDIEFKKGKETEQNPSTDETCRLLKREGTIAEEKEKTFYVMGADNIERGLIGWANPKALMDQVTIVVVTRGEPVEEEELMKKDDENLITPYYKSKEEQKNKIQWSVVREERKKEYSDYDDYGDYVDYDIWPHIRDLERVEFTVSEFSSSILRKLAKGDSDSFNEADLTALLNSLDYFKREIPGLANKQIIVLLIIIKDLKLSIEDQKKVKDIIFDSQNIPIIVSYLTPIAYRELKDEYSKNNEQQPEKMNFIIGGRKKKPQTRKLKPLPKRRTRK
jgi:nicotinic acid mononucleotide adenylyltransferase